MVGRRCKPAGELQPAGASAAAVWSRTVGERRTAHVMSLTNADGQQVGSATYTLSSTEGSTGEPAWGFRAPDLSAGQPGSDHRHHGCGGVPPAGFAPVAVKRRQRGKCRCQVRRRPGGHAAEYAAEHHDDAAGAVPSDARNCHPAHAPAGAAPGDRLCQEINVFMPVAEQFERIEVQVTGEETVQTEAGSYATWVIELNTRDSQSKAWIGQRGAPRAGEVPGWAQQGHPAADGVPARQIGNKPQGPTVPSIAYATGPRTAQHVSLARIVCAARGSSILYTLYH